MRKKKIFISGNLAKAAVRVEKRGYEESLSSEEELTRYQLGRICRVACFHTLIIFRLLLRRNVSMEKLTDK